MSVFASAIDDLFADPNLAREAMYRADGVGDGVTVHVIARQPDRIVEFGEVAVHSATSLFEVRVAEVPTPAAGDTLELDGGTFVVQGEPRRDAGRILWTIDTRPA